MKNKFISMLVLTVGLQVFAEDDFSKETFKSKDLGHKLFMLEGAGGNITASLGSDGVFLVDDDFAEMGAKLLAKLKELGGSSPRFIVNTHFHYDHTGGNKVFGSTATIIAAGEVRDRLVTIQKLWGKDHPAAAPQALPILTFEQSISLHLNGENIRVVHFPHGHTDGDTVVFFEKAKVVSMGDLYFSGMYPIFHPEHQGSLDGFLENIKHVIDVTPDDAQIVPGHGPLSTKAELEKYYRMILASVAAVKAGIQKGQTLQQIQKTGLALEWDSFGHGYLTTEQWLALVFRGVQTAL